MKLKEFGPPGGRTSKILLCGSAYGTNANIANFIYYRKTRLKPIVIIMLNAPVHLIKLTRSFSYVTQSNHRVTPVLNVYLTTIEWKVLVDMASAEKKLVEKLVFFFFSKKWMYIHVQ